MQHVGTGLQKDVKREHPVSFDILVTVFMNQRWPNYVFRFSVRPTLVDSIAPERLEGISSNLAKIFTWTPRRTD